MLKISPPSQPYISFTPCRITQLTLHATRYTLHATCYMLHATRYMLLATCYMLHATCYMLHATRNMLHITHCARNFTSYTPHIPRHITHIICHAPRSMHTPMYSHRLETVESQLKQTLDLANAKLSRNDSSRGPSNPYQPRNSRKRRKSDSPPPRYESLRAPTEERKQKQPFSKSTGQVFRTGAASSTLPACAVCLGCFPHSVFNCKATTLWDKSTPAYCYKNQSGRLVNPKGSILCSDWQRLTGCDISSHSPRHECSGCGKHDHGAQECPRAEKN